MRGLDWVCLVAVVDLTRGLRRCLGLGLGRLKRIPDAGTVTKWFHSTRLETRTKESNICASSRVLNLLA